MTQRAHQVIANSDVVVGYRGYVDRVMELLDGKDVISSGMGKERDSALISLDRAAGGSHVALLSGGDPGIYGMASPVIAELLAYGDDPLPFDVILIPGVTASTASGSLMGSPLAQDHGVISLSDRFVPWEVISQRLRALMAADMVVVLYELSSRHRPENMKLAHEIIQEHRPSETPVAVVKDAYQESQSIAFTTVGKLLDIEYDMRTTMIVGSSETTRVGNWMSTPRFHSRLVVE
jgi:precorrin-3B C17-methyltransferase